jgi:dTDP-4-dehydrorhamnose 3,5-epimerase
MSMRVTPTALPDVLVIEPEVHRDARGLFVETYQADRYYAAGITAAFVQDNQSRSMARSLRGLHAQVGPRAQGKLVRVLAGTIYDVAVDVRRASPTFRRWVGVRLTAESFTQMYLPPGFLHGFCVLSAEADVAYKCTAPWDAAAEISVRWNDPDLGIEWPIADPVLSERDAGAPLLREVIDHLPP